MCSVCVAFELFLTVFNGSSDNTKTLPNVAVTTFRRIQDGSYID